MNVRCLSMLIFRAALLVVVGTFTCISALCQSGGSPAHDPRIGQILDSLEQAHAIQQTDLSPDGNLIAWNAGGIEVAPLTDPSDPKAITACAAGQKGR